MKPEGEVRRYQSGAMPIAVDVYLESYDGPSWVRRELRGQSGWLQVSKASLSTPISDWTATLLAAVTDDGRQLGKMSSAAFLVMRCSMPQTCFDDPPEDLEGITEMLFWDFLGGCDLRHLDMLEKGEAELNALIRSEQGRGEKVLSEAEAYIADLGRQRRQPDCDAERRANLDARIAIMNDKHAAASGWLVRHLRDLRERGERLETNVLEALENHGEYEELYTARWTARSRYDRVVDRALMAELTRTTSLPGVPLQQRLDAQERWEIAEVARLAINPPVLVEATRRKAGAANRKSITAAGPDVRAQWRREEQELLAVLEEWQEGKSTRCEPDEGMAKPEEPAEDPALAFPKAALVPTQTSNAPAEAVDNSLDIDALIESDMRELLKDLKP